MFLLGNGSCARIGLWLLAVVVKAVVSGVKVHLRVGQAVVSRAPSRPDKGNLVAFLKSPHNLIIAFGALFKQSPLLNFQRTCTAFGGKSLGRWSISAEIKTFLRHLLADDSLFPFTLEHLLRVLVNFLQFAQF